jgi:type IV pilus assembly protein PilM
MSVWNQIARLVTDPPPSHLFEVSEAGIAFANGKETSFEAFEPGTVVVSPVEDNLLRADAVSAAIGRVAASKTSKSSASSSKKRKPAAVILPDYAARVTVLDFDSFPSSLEEQNSLVRFRVKKTIPFDIDSAAVSHHVQPHPASKKVDVIAVTVALEVIARYEALFRSSGFQPGVVTTSALAALNLYRGEGVAVLAKVSGRALTVSVISSNIVKLFRCVALEEASEEEILGVLHPTFAYVEDELGSPVSRLITCGIPQDILGRLKCEVEPLRSRFGTPGPYNAGLLGYLESVEN